MNMSALAEGTCRTTRRLSKSGIALAGALAVLVGFAPQAKALILGPQLVPNYNMENATLSPWLGWTANITIDLSNGPSLSGNQSMKIENTAIGGKGYQNSVPLISGKEYLIKFDYKSGCMTKKRV